MARRRNRPLLSGAWISDSFARFLAHFSRTKSASATMLHERGPASAGSQMAELGLGRSDPSRELGAATAQLRRNMVERQLQTFDVNDIPLLERFLNVPREIFLPPELAPLAYSDLGLFLKDSQGRKVRYLLPPLILARMLQEAEIDSSDRVLDVAGGAGYSAALLAGLAGEVVALESDPALVAQAKENLKAAGIENVRVECGPLGRGLPAAGPFDIILIHGGVEEGLEPLLDTLKPNGRLIAIAKMDEESGQQVVRFERREGVPSAFRPLFDASAPVLHEFAKAPAFAF
jgi:protein-L-isoaspartate(D-aspartate) O-methyltransferase